MKTLTAIVLAAGEGSRFKVAGYLQPKPLLEVEGKPLVVQAALSLDPSLVSEYVFAVRKEHVEQYRINSLIQSYFPQAKIYSIDKTTRGPLDTCYRVKHLVSSDSVVIVDCDLRVKSLELEEKLRKGTEKCELVCFDSNDSRYSYVRMDGKKVAGVVEKQAVSTKAVCGVYYFPKKVDFFGKAKQVLDSDSGECFVSKIYKYFLEEGVEIEINSCDFYRSYGTPEEFERNTKV